MQATPSPRATWIVGTRATKRMWQVLAAASIVAGTLPAAAFAAGTAPLPENAEAGTQAWQTVRQLDCARCHGRDHDGLAAPSVLEFVRSQSRERFNLKTSVTRFRQHQAPESQAISLAAIRRAVV